MINATKVNEFLNDTFIEPMTMVFNFGGEAYYANEKLSAKVNLLNGDLFMAINYPGEVKRHYILDDFLSQYTRKMVIQ